MTRGHRLQGTFDLLQVLRVGPARVSEEQVLALLRLHPVRSASRRGFVLCAGSQLLRLTEDVGWTAERLPMLAGVADEPGHQHALVPVQLSDWDVLVCVGCGSEW